jgi:hypothetical protein
MLPSAIFSRLAPLLTSGLHAAAGTQNAAAFQVLHLLLIYKICFVTAGFAFTLAAHER